MNLFGLKGSLLVFLSIFPIVGGCRQNTDTIVPPEGYELVWNDEFEQDGTPSDAWNYEIGFVRNQELQWYQPDNATIKDGYLIIEGRKETKVNPDYSEASMDWRKNRRIAEYTSSCLTTKDSFTFKYGRVEVRAKIPTAEGVWPAIWTLGNRWEWPQNGEIDMMEYYIKDGVPCILANVCWGAEKRWTGIWDEKAIPFSYFYEKDSNWADKFHVWRMDWDESHIRLYLDDELLNETDLSKTQNRGFQGNNENPFSNDIEGFGHYILLNLAIGSNGGTPDLSQMPVYFIVDYVRVYRKL